MIRPVTNGDTSTVMSIAETSGLFDADELEEVRQTLAAYLAGSLGDDHRWVVHDAGDPTGVAYFAPEAFGVGVWNLYMLAVLPDQRGTGHGAALVEHVEAATAAAGARILLIETSGTPPFERTRTFYDSLGYTAEARIRDYYAPGDDKVIYWKSLAA